MKVKKALIILKSFCVDSTYNFAKCVSGVFLFIVFFSYCDNNKIAILLGLYSILSGDGWTMVTIGNIMPLKISL